MIQNMLLSDPGEGLLEAEIVQWLVKPGDHVEVNDLVLEIETAKSLVELPAPYAGVVGEFLHAEGDVVPVGAVLVTIDDGAPSETPEEGSGAILVGYGTSAQPSRRARAGEVVRPPAADRVHDSYGLHERVSRPVDEVAASAALNHESVGGPLPRPGFPTSPDAAAPRPLAKPVVRRLARDLGVDLACVTPSGPGATVTASDVARAAVAAADGAAGQVPTHVDVRVLPSEPANTDPATAPTASGSMEVSVGGVRRIPVRGVRRQMVASMTASLQVPQASLWVTVDVTETVTLIESLKGRREFAGLRISPILVLAKAVCLAVARHPEVNSCFDAERGEIIVYDDVNLGIAAATPRGLVVPNVKAANRMNLVQLAETLNAMVAAAREARITPADCAHGTFTITNVGVFGIEGGTPILNANESAILCMGTIERRPSIVGSGADERIEPRALCTLTLTIDHRVLDGELGSRFLADVATILRDPGLALLF